MDDMTNWSRFANSGKVEDYLFYRRSLQNKASNKFGDKEDENEHTGTGSQRTEYT